MVAIQWVHAPLWFMMLGILLAVFGFVDETRRAYDLLRQAYAERSEEDSAVGRGVVLSDNR